MRRAREAALESNALRRRALAQLRQLQGNVRVLCRLRPLAATAAAAALHTGAEGEVVLRRPLALPALHGGSPPGGARAGGALGGGGGARALGGGGGALERLGAIERVWEFDRTFGVTATQEHVFAEVAPLAACVIDGFSACVLAYGATGSGKTHTMMGPVSDRGVNYRLLEELMRLASERRAEGTELHIRASLVEIYNEEMVDLLAEAPAVVGGGAVGGGAVGGGLDGGGLPRRTLRFDAAAAAALRERGHVGGAFTCLVHTVDDVLDMMTVGGCYRTLAATALNPRSSRSHTVLSVSVHASEPLSGECTLGILSLVGDLLFAHRTHFSHMSHPTCPRSHMLILSLVDLAGAELVTPPTASAPLGGEAGGGAGGGAGTPSSASPRACALPPRPTPSDAEIFERSNEVAQTP